MDDVRYNFILDVILIDPVKKIIKGLEQKEFRDIDINYLDERLEAFTTFACKIMELNVKLAKEGEKKLNTCTINKYIERFSILLKFFESYKQ